VNKKYFFSTIALCFFTFNLIAAEDIYGVVSLGYSNSEFAVEQPNNTSYKLTLGYQVDRQWYAEFGFQQLADQSLQLSLPTTLNEAQSYEPKIQATALYAALLGKARGQMGELFYRLGILKTDIRGQSLTAGSLVCKQGTATIFSVDSGEEYTLCDYDEGGIAGVVGLGFDFFLTARSMIRVEAEHIRGQNDLTINAAYIGLRYNF
jgi:hypothetical protein